MESNCFICGIGKDYFDAVPHGFDTHVQQEHNLANYMSVLSYNQKTNRYIGGFGNESLVIQLSKLTSLDANRAFKIKATLICNLF